MATFHPVLDDPRRRPDTVERLVLCSGKLYYDIVGHEAREQARGVAVARLEQLYPFPVEAVRVARDATRGSRRSCGPRRSRRTWARGARSDIVSRDGPREHGPGPALRGAHLEGEPERGVPDRPPGGAGPHRARGVRRRRLTTRPPGRRPGPGPRLHCGVARDRSDRSSGDQMAVETSISENPFTVDNGAGDDPSSLARAIQEHLDLKQRNADLNGDMPLDRYRSRILSRTILSSSPRSRPASRRRSRVSRLPSRRPHFPGRGRASPSRAPRSTTACGAARATSTGASDDRAPRSASCTRARRIGSAS